MTQASIDVLYIGGTGRSGSTMLLRVLGTLDQHFPTGELSRIWKGHVILNHLCGCGESFRDCEFWNAVMDDAFGGIDQVDAAHLISLQESTQGWRHLPMLATPALRTPAFQRRLREYAAALEALYLAIARVSGSRVLIDASKMPAHAFVLAEIPSIRPRMIHLVRDSRACVYSWQRKKKLVGVPGETQYMHRYNHFHTSVDWNVNHTFLRIAARRYASYAAYRYEDIASDPRLVLTEMAETLGMSGTSGIPFVSDDSVSLGPDHSLWGNPNRFERGVITIRPDMEWQDRMSTSQRAQVTMLTLPWLARFGYLAKENTNRTRRQRMPTV